MPKTYVSRVQSLEIDGQFIIDYDSVTIPEIPLAESVNLMNGIGVLEIPKRIDGLVINFVYPRDGAIPDWENMTDSRMTIQIGERRVSFNEVHIKTIGTLTVTPGEPATQEITFMAEVTKDDTPGVTT